MKIERIEKIENNMKNTEGKVSATELVERLNSMSFWKLLSETSKIQIPIIQRDYAQGRENEKTNKIRSLFLQSLIEAIESKKDSLELDFVYGNIDNGIFQPLDGQQRLTTLFLLHWYIALKTGALTKDIKHHFLKFTYETRISSREFCNELVANGEELGEGITISKKITDSSWFFLSWKKDPTIKAMLVMLDSIENRLKGENDEELKSFWGKLTSENPPITFHFKQLNDIGLTDDLYIKMNARGKALTGFENFKARFERHIQKVIFEKDEKGQEIIENGEKVLLKDNWEKDVEDPTQTFSHKVDTVWADLFWKHRGDDNIIDHELEKFIAGIAINNYAERLEIYESEEEEIKTRELLEENKKKSITDEAVKRERIERRINVLFNNPGEIDPEDFPTKTSFEYLKNCFDVYSNKENKYDELIPANLTLWDFLDVKKVKINNQQEIDNTLFVEFVKDDKETTYKQRVLFYAQTQYLLNTDTFKSDSFSEWMRVVRNIVQNNDIVNSNIIGTIGLINELSSGCENIYEMLSNTTIKSVFATKQIKEEKLKATLMQSDIIWKSQLFKTEDNNFLKGEINFLLDFAKSDIGFDYQSFKKLSDDFLLLFASKDDLLRAALLTQCDYKIWDGYTYSLKAHRYSLLNSGNEWKDALRKKHENLINAIFKLLEFTNKIDDTRLEKLYAIISNYISNNDYRDLIISNEKLLANCWHKRICLDVDNTTLYLLNKTRVVGENYREILI